MRYYSITKPDINNGLGCRVTLWISGCDKHCPGCHNSFTWDKNSGKFFDFESTWKELKSILELPYIKGLTLSGGDPIVLDDDEKLDSVFRLVKLFKDTFGDTKDLWIFTGCTMEELVRNYKAKKILQYTDYIVDGRFEIAKRDITIAFRGSTNQNIWKKNQETKVFELINIE